jgi:uncharacterized protein
VTRDMTRLDFEQLSGIVSGQRHPLIFATVSGAHLYGFPSGDSDVDLRGAHLLPAVEVVGLRKGPDTLTRDWIDEDAEIDLVTHDLGKFCGMLLQRNGYVAEQLLSPLVIATSDLHAELVALAPRCLTRFHAFHYRGFAHTQRRLFASSGQLKPLLYTFRTLLTGIHLMRSGEVVASLPVLTENVAEAPGYLPDLIAAKASGEHLLLRSVEAAPELPRLHSDIDALTATLEAAHESSQLADRPSAAEALHDLVVRARLGTK